MDSSDFAAAAHRSEPRVLIIDDDECIRKVVRLSLRHLKFAFFEAADGDEGIARARELRPDVVICDFAMPGIGGYELVTALQSELINGGRIILMTGDVGSQDLKEAAIVADAYLPKPFTPRQLEATVDAQLKKLRELAADH